MQYIPELQHSRDLNLHLLTDYNRVYTTVRAMFDRGLIWSATGNCIAISEMLQHLLRAQGIDSRLIECQVSMISTDAQGHQDFKFVGYPGMSMPGQIDTHVVVATCTEPPLLVDLSIAPLLTPGRFVLIEELTDARGATLAEYHLEDRVLTYQIKSSPQLPELHQSNLLTRILEERATRSTLQWMKWSIFAVAGLGLINSLLNIGILIFNH